MRFFIIKKVTISTAENSSRISERLYSLFLNMSPLSPREISCDRPFKTPVLINLVLKRSAVYIFLDSPF
jgi:hypothetical protein